MNERLTIRIDETFAARLAAAAAQAGAQRGRPMAVSEFVRAAIEQAMREAETATKATKARKR